MHADDPREPLEPLSPASPEALPVDEPTSDDPVVENRPTRKAAWLALGGVALTLALIWAAPGISPSSSDDQVASGIHADDEDDAAAAIVGKDAPLHFTLKDMNGADVKLASFKGKVIVLNFWATWCEPCRAEIPWLVELQQEYPDDLVVLGLSVDDPVDKLKPYAEEMKMNYPVLVGNGREDVQDAYGPLWGIPVSVFIDREGKVAKRHPGIATKEQFEQEIKALL